MITSGIVAKATTDANVLDVIADTALLGGGRTSFEIVNEGPAGFASIDGGNNWFRVPANSAVNESKIPRGVHSLKIKRDGAVNMSGVFGRAW